MTVRSGLYVRPGFLPAPLYQALCAHVESSDGDLAAVQPAPGASLSVAQDVRQVWEVDLPDALHDAVLAAIERVRPDLASVFQETLEPCDAVAALRYPPGAFYRSHRDAAARPDAYGLHRRAVSLVIFLNSGAPEPDAAFDGGRLRFLDVPHEPDGYHDVVPVAGTLAAFRSSWLHEVTPVVSGQRAVLAAWLCRPLAAPA